VAAPRFLVAADERLVGSLQKKNLVDKPLGFQILQHLHKGIEKLAAADVDHEGDLANPSGGLHTQLGKLGDEHRRQIVDAKITQVLHRRGRPAFYRPPDMPVR
jgi:hypothetical protein